LNFTAIYPVLKILGGDQKGEGTLQDWVDERISATQQEINALQAAVDRYSKEAKELEEKPPSKWRFKEDRDVASKLASLQSKLAAATADLNRHQLAKKFIYSFFPAHRFRTLAWVVGMVVIAVAIKGVFEFWQESLVGSVVNLSLFDLRNRFYRNAIHL